MNNYEAGMHQDLENMTARALAQANTEGLFGTKWTAGAGAADRLRRRVSLELFSRECVSFARELESRPDATESYFSVYMKRY